MKIRSGDFGNSKFSGLMAGLSLAILIAASVACVSDIFSSGSSSSSEVGASGIADPLGAPNAVIAGVVAAPAGGFSVATALATSTIRVYTDVGDYITTADPTTLAYTLNVRAGRTYNVIAQREGYKPIIVDNVTLTAGQTKTVNLSFTAAEKLAAGEKSYVGSNRCLQCHGTGKGLTHTNFTPAGWATSVHKYGIQGPEDSPGILTAPRAQYASGYDLVNQADWAAYGANAPRLSKTGDTYFVTIGNVAYPVRYAMGHKWKQRYLTRIGLATYTLPIQYNVATGLWVEYDTSTWYATNKTPLYTAESSIETDVNKRSSWDRKCMGCHAVTGVLSIKFDTSTTSGIAQHSSSWVEKGIGCEACHGPGSDHAAFPSRSNITNPARLTGTQANDACGQCHSRGLSVGKLAGLAADSYNATSDTWTLEYYYDGSRTYRPGDTLVHYYTDAGGYWNDSAEVKSSKQHHQQWNDFYQSGHTAPGAALTVTCGSCHDAHGTAQLSGLVKSSATDNTLCLSCHGSGGAAKQRFMTNAAVTQHTGDSHTTYNPGGTGAGRCITCHMPYTAKTAVNYDIRSHTFRVLRPHNTRRFYNTNASQETMPNSCQQACHNGVSSLGTNFGTGTAGALTASVYYDSTVQRPQMVMPDTAAGKVSGTVYVSGATHFSDTFGVWVSVDFTDRGTVTNRNGAYYLSLDAPGTYTIRAMKSGYDSAVAETVVVRVGYDTTINFTLTANSSARYALRPYRCMTCHGGTVGSEWRKSGYAGTQLSEAEGSTDLAAGHGLMANSPSGGCGVKCHEARSAKRYMETGDTTTVGFSGEGNAGRRSQTCQVCHKPHDSTTDPYVQLHQYNTTGFDTGYFYAKNSSAGQYGSMRFPATYKSTVCIMCHNGRTAPTDSGAGLRTNSSESRPVSTPHVGNNAEGFFGFRDSTTAASINFDSFANFIPRNSTHSDTNWGQSYSYQAYVYSGGSPKLVASNGAAIVKTDRFTCVSCHMFNQGPGAHSTSSTTYTAEDGGHTFKPDIRACGVCHDPVYISLNPYTNSLKSGSGDVGYWGTASWGVNSSGTTLGFDRPVTALPHQRNTGGSTANSAPDAVSNDYDGDGTAEGAHTEAEHLFFRVMAALSNGSGTDTFHHQTSGIGAAGTDSFGHVFLGSSPYWRFNTTQAWARNVQADELRVAWNLVLLEHDESNLGVHNLRFAIETLRASWTVLGRLKTGNASWVPPGDDY